MADTAALFGLPFTLAPIFVLGMILLGAAFLRPSTAPTWLGVVTIAGALAMFSNDGGPRTFLTLPPVGGRALGRRGAVLRRR